MSQVIQKLNELEGQLDTELKAIDRKMKDLKSQRQVLTKLKIALKPTAPRKMKQTVKEIKPEGGNS